MSGVSCLVKLSIDIYELSFGTALEGNLKGIIIIKKRSGYIRLVWILNVVSLFSTITQSST